MRYYEIRNRKTGREFSAIASKYQEACEKNGEKVKDCRCVYSVEI